MKRNCLHCEKPIVGRSDKLFCCSACKNAYHNEHRRHKIEFKVDGDLHRNRNILQKLMPAGTSRLEWPKELLEHHGFSFDVFTGLKRGPGRAVIYMVYDFEWQEVKGKIIQVRRLVMDEVDQPSDKRQRHAG